MFGFLRTNKHIQEAEPIPQVGCFGKLPIYDEFIRHNVNGRPIQDLDEWIQQGFSHHSRGLQTRPEKPELRNYTYHFVFSGSGERQAPVIGTMMGSHDRSGRQYPFVLFKMLLNSDTGGLASTLPCACNGFFDSALNLCTTDWSLQPINMLKKRVESLNTADESKSRSDYIESEINALCDITKKEFWQKLLCDSDTENAPVYVEVMQDLLKTVERKAPIRTSWGIEIPLPDCDNAHVHVSFWVHVAESLLGDRGWHPHYIWGDVKNKDRQSLYLFFRPITPIFFSHLLGHRVDNGVLINLSQECLGQIQVSPTAKHIGSADAELNMMHALDEWLNWSSD